MPVSTGSSSPKMTDAGCVIMASGLGKRFGGNKLMAPFGGEPMIARILDATDGIFSRRVVVTRHPDVSDYCRSRGVEILLHDFPYRSDTVRLGLEAMLEFRFCMFCPADQPLLRHSTVVSLVRRAAEEPEFIWRTAFDGRPGAPILFPQWAYPELLSLPEGKGGGVVAQKYPHQVRLMPVREEWELMDADTPEALRFLEETYSGRD